MGNGGEETQKNTKERFRFLSIFHRFFLPKSTLARFPARICEKTPKLDGKFLFFEAPEEILALLRYLGDFRRSRKGAKIREKCVRKPNRKKGRKKISKMVRVGVMRVASGEVRRGHTSYDSLRRVTAIRCKVSHTPQDLLRRAADLKPCGSCRPPFSS